MIGLLTTSCENAELKEAAEKKKKTNEYNSLQLSKLKDKWSNHERWNKNEDWHELLGEQLKFEN